VSNFTDYVRFVYSSLYLSCSLKFESIPSFLPYQNPWFGSMHIQHILISSFWTNYRPDFLPYHDFEVLISFHLNPPNNIYVFSTSILSLIILTKLKSYTGSIASLIILTIYPYTSVLMINFNLFQLFHMTQNLWFSLMSVPCICIFFLDEIPSQFCFILRLWDFDIMTSKALTFWALWY